MPTYNYSTNPETLLLLAWCCSTLDLPALAQKDRQNRPHKYPQHREEWLPVFPEHMLSEQITEALKCLQGGYYDPVLQSLVKYRLLLVDVEAVVHAIGLKNFIRPSHGLFYSDDPFLVSTTQKGPANETDAFWQAVSNHAAVQERLTEQSQTWQCNICLGAQYLRFFFLEYTRLLFRHREAPFFVAEFLGRSLQQVDWHAIAAHIQGVDAFSCKCNTSELSREYDEAIHVPLFQELLTEASEEIRRISRRLPNHLRSNALFLSGLCADTARICTSEPL